MSVEASSRTAWSGMVVDAGSLSSMPVTAADAALRTVVDLPESSS